MIWGHGGAWRVVGGGIKYQLLGEVGAGAAASTLGEVVLGLLAQRRFPKMPANTSKAECMASIVCNS